MTARRVLTTGFAAVIFIILAHTAFAVPIPFKNCGSPKDILSVQKMFASIWPPVGTPAPLQATALYDSATGNLNSLTIDLFLGPEWVFQTGNLAAPVVAGFVALPTSIPLTLVSPTLPIPAGPVGNTQTLTSSNPGSQPVTIQSNVAIGQSIPSVNATLTLTYNGSPGFPVPSSTAGTYTASVRAASGSGPEIFCVTFSLINLSFVEDATTSTALSSSLNPSASGQPVTFTATVTSPNGTPAGNVTFFDGATSLGTAAVDASGNAAFTIPLAAGTHNMSATFNGSGGFAGSTSTSAVLVQTVIVPTPALDGPALFLLAIALAAVGALLLRL